MFENKIHVNVIHKKCYKHIVLFTINGEQKWLEFIDIEILNATLDAFKVTFGKFDYRIIREEI